MSHLTQLICEACDAGAKLLSNNEIETLLPEVEAWHVIEENGVKKLKRTFQTNNYTQSISFTNAIAELAESSNHHPLLIIEYSSVTVLWWSHKAKGLHKNDFIMAAKTSELF